MNDKHLDEHIPNPNVILVRVAPTWREWCRIAAVGCVIGITIGLSVAYFIY